MLYEAYTSLACSDAGCVDSRIGQAVIAGLFVALGWIVNGWQNRRRDEALRLLRVNDVQRALYAEIRAYVAVLKRDDLAKYGDDILQKIRTEPDYFPVIPRENNASIFSAIVGDIHILPRAVIDPVALYYSQLVAIQQMIEDLKQVDKFVIGPERAARIYADYIALKVEAIELGDDAMIMMGGYIEGGAERLAEIEAQQKAEDAAHLRDKAPRLKSELNALRARINTPDGGRSGQ